MVINFLVEKIGMRVCSKAVLFIIFCLTIPVGKADYKREVETIHLEGVAQNKRWVDVYKDQDQNVAYLIETLERSQKGKELLELAQSKARKNGFDINSLIIPDIGSITDTTLTRKFSESRPDKVKYFTRSKIHINRELSVTSAVLDLAHELTHFIYRDAFNPYSNKFTIDKFIVSTIEGKGGEVEAYINECKILTELFSGMDQEQSKCSEIRNPDGSYSRRLGAKLFYQVGSFKSKFHNILELFGVEEKKFQVVSNETPSFISSAYGEPYPYAALKEFVNVVRKACQNDEKRVVLFRDKVRNIGRLPASVEEKQVFTKQNFLKLKNSYFERCSSPGLFKANDLLF